MGDFRVHSELVKKLAESRPGGTAHYPVDRKRLANFSRQYLEGQRLDRVIH